MHSTFQPWTQFQTELSEAETQAYAQAHALQAQLNDPHYQSLQQQHYAQHQHPIHNPPPVQHQPPQYDYNQQDLAYLEAQQRISMAEWEAQRRVAPVIGAGSIGPDPIQDISLPQQHTAYQAPMPVPTKIAPPTASPSAFSSEEMQTAILELKRQNQELRQDNTTLAHQVKHLLDEKAQLQSEVNWVEKERTRFKPLLGNLFIRV